MAKKQYDMNFGWFLLETNFNPQDTIGAIEIFYFHLVQVYSVQFRRHKPDEYHHVRKDKMYGRHNGSYEYIVQNIIIFFYKITGNSNIRAKISMY